MEEWKADNNIWSVNGLLSLALFTLSLFEQAPLIAVTFTAPLRFSLLLLCVASLRWRSAISELEWIVGSVWRINYQLPVLALCNQVRVNDKQCHSDVSPRSSLCSEKSVTKKVIFFYFCLTLIHDSLIHFLSPCSRWLHGVEKCSIAAAWTVVNPAFNTMRRLRNVFRVLLLVMHMTKTL